ncbi:MAG: hypothetical protein J6S67_04055 [Methanobrevibacter sp.]|nr:hypothetical protein [Methanobrevibacter sp.]
MWLIIAAILMLLIIVSVFVAGVIKDVCSENVIFAVISGIWGFGIMIAFIVHIIFFI